MLPATDYDVWFSLHMNVLDGDRALFRHIHRFYNALQGGMVVAPFFLKACAVLLGLLGALSDLSSPLFDRNNIICLQEVHGKDEFLQTIQVLAPQFRLFGTFLLNNENAGGSAICIHRDLLPKEALVTHVITCHGRDHLVNSQSERHSLVIVNVHFEPDLTLRQLRGKLSLIHPHWPAYPNGVGVILGDFNICDPEEGRFNVWNQTFTDGDPGKTAVFQTFSTCP